MKNLSLAILTIGLAYFAFEYNSQACGVGAFFAFLATFLAAYND